VFGHSLFAASLCSILTLHAAAAPALAVDANASRHPISPYVYGINEYADNGLGRIMRIPLRRSGGDATTSYNWQIDVSNAAGDWYFENFAQYNGAAPPLPNGSSFDLFHEANLQTGTLSLGTISLMDWTPKDTASCSFSVARYGAQQKENPYNSDCGNGILLNGQQINNDPHDAYQPVDQTFAQQWVRYLIERYGPANAGGVRLWSMDNEPEWWLGVHTDIYPSESTYDDMMARNLKWATAVKEVDPTALVTGPVPAGWSGMLFSRKDMVSGWNFAPPWQYWENPVDQKAHGGVPWVPYYLQQMNAAEAQSGQRLLDVLDVHGYVTPSGLSSSAGDAAMETLRMTSTRVLWDPGYFPPGGGYEDATGAEVAPQLIPRMHQWVNDNYPGTMLGITEYWWHALDTITGAIAQADVLGIFGREALDIGTLWGPPNPTDPGAFAFQIFLNYDGAGNQFGETSISGATSDPDTLSIFAAQRSDTALTILVLNKTYGDVADNVSLANFAPAGTAQVWQYSSANLNAIVQKPDVAISNNTISATFPALSMTLLVVPAAQSMMSVPKPVITWVKHAASWDASGVAPGEIVAIRGQSLGPAAEQDTQLDSIGKLTTSLGGVRVLFNGVPAPLYYTLPTQVAAIVPYEVAANPAATNVNVQVEYQGNRSDPFTLPVVAVLPGLFTNDYSGLGQAALLNQDGSVITRNGLLNPSTTPLPTQPATRGSYILIFATGEGQTTPPGVDGRRAFGPYPKPVLSCSVKIGGLDAHVDYCGATPQYTAGELQVNAQVPMAVAPGNNVPIQLTIGTAASPDGVTIVVQ
jgi:uncharacterized protein (TIGR03437 family)